VRARLSACAGLFERRGVDRKVAFVPGMAKEYTSCGECFGLCSGGIFVSQCGSASLDGEG
jgi:hypothetical protein